MPPEERGELFLKTHSVVVLFLVLSATPGLGGHVALLPALARRAINLAALRACIRDLVGPVAAVRDYHGEIVWDTSKPNGQPRRRLDITRAEQEFGFRARTGLREGLEATVGWYRKRKAASTY